MTRWLRAIRGPAPVRAGWLLAVGGGCITLIAGAGLSFVLALSPPDSAKPVVHVASLDGDDLRPGGHATTDKSINRDVFSHASAGMSFELQADFKVGNAIFRRNWVSAPASTDSSDGLGPLFNARACQACHIKDGRGHPPSAPDDAAVSMLMRFSVPPESDKHKQMLADRRINSIGDPVYGGQLQDFATQGQDIEGRFGITYDPVPIRLGDGTTVELRKPRYTLRDLAFGPTATNLMMSPRIAPPMIGLGLLEAVNQADIKAGADPDDADGDGVSGRTNEVWSMQDDRVVIGRFGWKAGTPSIRQQTAEAFAADMGLSNPLIKTHTGDCTAAQAFCQTAPNGASERNEGLEVGSKLFDLVVFYSQNLAVPARRDAEKADVVAGKRIFHDAGCAGCHRPSWTTAEVAHQPHLSRQVIWPYTDLLLHDMGEGLADGRPEGLADGREWRTPPLWGVGLTETVGGHTFFLHDGRARNLEEAILWHGGEAQVARDAYARLDKSDRERLVAFVNSL